MTIVTVDVMKGSESSVFVHVVLIVIVPLRLLHFGCIEETGNDVFQLTPALKLGREELGFV